jgi:preprotein translocase subunit SecE
MGKVKDEAPAKSTKAAVKAPTMRGARQSLGPFLANLFRADLVKPTQGRHARLWTAIGLAVLVAAGLYRLYVTQLADYAPLVRFGVPAAVALVLGWVIFRVVHYPPFADFLIATEAEMNKVSWTSKSDLYRATTVVLLTVLVLAVYLFLVDWLWSWLLQLIGVLRTSDVSGFGDTG